MRKERGLKIGSHHGGRREVDVWRRSEREKIGGGRRPGEGKQVWDAKVGEARREKEELGFE